MQSIDLKAWVLQTATSFHGGDLTLLGLKKINIESEISEMKKTELI